MPKRKNTDDVRQAYPTTDGTPRQVQPHAQCVISDCPRGKLRGRYVCRVHLHQEPVVARRQTS